jgi:hypothetical protein
MGRGQASASHSELNGKQLEDWLLISCGTDGFGRSRSRKDSNSPVESQEKRNDNLFIEYICE